MFFTKLVLKDITRIFVEQRLTKICIFGGKCLVICMTNCCVYRADSDPSGRSGPPNLSLIHSLALTDYDPLCKRKTGENDHILKYFFVIWFKPVVQPPKRAPDMRSLFCIFLSSRNLFFGQLSKRCGTSLQEP